MGTGTGTGTGRGARVVWAVLMLAGCGGGGRIAGAPGALDLDARAIDFGAVALGDPARHALTLRNVGRVPVQIARLVLAGPFAVADFPSNGVALASGQTLSLRVVFSPLSEGRAEGSLTIVDDAGPDPTTVAMRGLGVKAHLVASDDTLSFGSVRLGGSGRSSLWLTNDSPAPVSTPVRFEGADAALFASATEALLQIGPGASVALDVEFRPDHLGSAEARLTLRACPACPAQVISLEGTGVASCIAADRQQVDFGSVELGREVSQAVRISNQDTAPVAVAEAFLASNSSADFRFEGLAPGAARMLAPGESLPLTVFFRPASDGARAGTLRVRAGGAGEPCWADVPLRGVGGEACLAVTPAAVDFGEVATGMTARASVVLANGDCGRDVWIDGIDVAGPAEIVAGASRATPFLLRQADSAELRLSVSPGAAGSYRARVQLRVSDAAHRPLARPPAPIPVSAEARAMAPCVFAVTPPRLDFGSVAVGARARLAARIANQGQDACFFSDVGLTSNSATSLQVAAPADGFALAPGAAADLEVSFAPDAAGAVGGAVQLYVSDPASPYRVVPIVGAGVRGCLSVAPAELDFGIVPMTCPAPVRGTQIENGCSGPVQILSLAAGAGTSAAFSVVGAPPFPVTLAAREGIEVRVQYAPTRAGLESQALYLDDGASHTLLSLRGIGASDAWRTDRFDQPARAAVDVLFVLDNSGSMADKQAAVGANLAAFLQSAMTHQIDYRLAVTTTGIDPSTGGWSACPGGAEGGEAGRLFPVDNSQPRILTPATPSPAQVWSAITTVGVCHWLEQGLEAAYRALTPPLVDHADAPNTPQPNDGNLGFLRPNARLALVFVSDEEDQSPQTVDFYFDALRALRPDPSRLTASAIVTPANLARCPSGTSSGSRYVELANRTGGVVESICTPDWATSLQRLGNNVFNAPSSFRLSAVPADPAQISVTVDGAPVASAGHWHFDADSQSVIFDLAAAPGPGAHVEVHYPVGCGS